MTNQVQIILTAVLIALVPALEAGARGRQAPRVRTGQRITSLVRSAGIIVAPARVKRGPEGSFRLERWALDKRGRPVRKEQRVQYKDGRQLHSELHYVIEDGKRRLNKVTTDVSAAPLSGAAVKVTTVADKHGASTRTELLRTGLRPLTRTGAYLRALAASPVVHFLVATGAWYLALDGLNALTGIDLHNAYAGLGALGTKGVIMAVEARQAALELALGLKRPRGVNRRQWRQLRKHARSVERRHAAVERARVVRDSGGSPEQVRAQIDRARQANHRALQSRMRLRALGAAL